MFYYTFYMQEKLGAYLNVRDAQAVECTSKGFSQESLSVLKAHLAYHGLILRSRGAFALFLQALQQYNGAVFARLSYMKCPLFMEDDAFVLIVNTLQHIRHVDLSECQALGHRAYQALCQFSGLEKLSVRGLYLRNITFSNIDRLRSLKDLQWTKFFNLPSSAFTFLQHLTQLISLDLSVCINLLDAELSSIGHLALLQRLKLHGCYQLTSESFYAISNLTTLTELDISACSGLSDRYFWKLTRLTQLQILDISGYEQQFTDAIFPSVEQLTQLAVVKMRECPHINGCGFRCLAQLPQLEWVDATECKALNDQALWNISSSKCLQYLDLLSCTGITDMGLKALSKLKSLKDLDLRFCRHITDHGLLGFASLPSLDHIDLFGCDAITPQAIQKLFITSSIDSIHSPDGSEIHKSSMAM